MVAWSSLSRDSGICPSTKTKENVNFLNVPDGVPLLRSSSCDYLEPLILPAFTEIENKSNKDELITFSTEKDSKDASNKPCGSGHPYTWTRVKWIGAPDCDVRQLRIAGLKVVFQENSDDEDCEEVLPICEYDHVETNNIEDVGNPVNVNSDTIALFQAKPMERNDDVQPPSDKNNTKGKTKVSRHLFLFIFLEIRNINDKDYQ